MMMMMVMMMMMIIIIIINNFTMKNCDRTKVKTITVKNSKKSLKYLFKTF